MTNSDDETILEQPVLEQPALEQPALEKPAHWAEARVTRILIAATIVLGSAGAGFLAGHVWPMTGLSGSKGQLASAGKSEVVEPRMYLPPVAVQEAKLAEPSALAASRPLEQSQPPATASLPDKSLAVLDAATAQQSPAIEKSISKEEAAKEETGAGKNVTARRETAKKPSRVARNPKNPEAAPNIAKSASAGAGASFRQDPALREFMTTPMRY
jgi:hypothetical protein